MKIPFVEVIVGVLVLCTGLLAWEVSVLRRELAARPPIAVIDISAYIAARDSANPEQPLESHTAEVRATAERLAAKGYVVMDRGSVLAQPSVFEVRP